MKGFNNSKIQRAYLRSVREARNLTRPKAIIEKGSLKPFKRASVLFTNIVNTRANLQGNLFELQQVLAAFPPYVSRGHGWGRPIKNRVILGRWNQDRSKPYPNKGRSEAARRVFQALPAEQRAYIRSIEGEVTE